MDYKIKKATFDEVEKIDEIYKSLIGHLGCAWNEYYPSKEDIISDIKNNGLYCMYNEDDIIAAAFAGKDNELNHISCWDKQIKRPCELARVGVKKQFHSKGLATQIIEYIEKDIKKQGFDGIHFLVSKTNPSALALYNKLNYKCCGELNKYDIDWYCYEKKI